MRGLGKRIETMEARHEVANKPVPNLDEPMRRIFNALYKGLPIEEPLVRRLSECGMYYVLDPIPNAKSFDDCILDLHDRMIARTMTEADHAVLRSLPLDALEKIGVSATDIIELLYGFSIKY